MPLYEYKCQSCGEQFEVLQKFSDAPLTSHQSCGGALERLIGAPALQFKGSGWYITDYARSGSGKEAAGGEKPAPSSNGASQETKSSSSGESSAGAAKSSSKSEK